MKTSVVVGLVVASLFGAAYLSRDSLSPELVPAQEVPIDDTTIGGATESVADLVDDATTAAKGALEELRNTSIGESVEDSLNELLD